jgi:hypothetical protein
VWGELIEWLGNQNATLLDRLPELGFAVIIIRIRGSSLASNILSGHRVTARSGVG